MLKKNIVKEDLINTGLCVKDCYIGRSRDIAMSVSPSNFWTLTGVHMAIYTCQNINLVLDLCLYSTKINTL
jgi:hypothetical protein